MAPTSGILYVTMAPKPSLPIAQFHDWYNNEHGPLRVRLPFCPNGCRYRASDLDGERKDQPEWMAIYDIADMDELTMETYTRLRKEPVQTQRERDTMKQITVDRKFYDFVEEKVGTDFGSVETFDKENQSSGNVIVVVKLTVQEGPEKGKELDQWYREEHLLMLSKVPGWRRSRRFITSSIEPRDETEYLALHEFAPENDIGGELYKAATSTKWREEVAKSVIKGKEKRTYNLYYVFGPAPRDLQSPADATALPSWDYSDGLTRTRRIADGQAYIESFVTTSDGAILPYRLEGSTNIDAPLIVLSNSVLVTYGIWDNFVASFFSHAHNKKYRILRYNTRGRTSEVGQKSVTVDLLASDIIALLDAIRVPKAAAIVGVSLGGATVLNAALKYPERIGSFISCDTNALAPAGNRKAWGERIAVAENQNVETESTGESLVGSKLAELTVRRWFVKESYDSGKMEAEIQRIKDLVTSNSLEGFKAAVQALYEYDLKEAMKSAKIKGVFLVGDGDGVLPKTMEEMAQNYAGGVELHVISGAGHLPMVEKPKEVADILTEFLS